MSSSELEELRGLLRSHNGDLPKLKKAMSKIMANVYVGKDMSSLFPDIVLQVQVKESSIKRLIGMFTTQYGHIHADTALLCINQLTKEIMHDPDPLQRGHALQTLGSLNIPALAEYIAPPIKLALQDSSPYVRRLAVGGCVKIFKMNESIYEEQMLSFHLKDLTDDFDEGVAAIAITALIQTKPDYAINPEYAMKLLKRLNDFSDWQVPLILSGIDTKNLCSNEKEVMEVLNLIDGFLDDCSPAVVLHIIQLIEPLIVSLKDPKMNRLFMERVKKSLLFKVKHSNPEISYWYCLQIPKIITDITVLSSSYSTFFPAYYDPTYLKSEKIRVLSMIISSKNVTRVTNELLECLNSPKHGDISQDLVECVAHCVLNHGDKMSQLVVRLASLLKSSSGSTISTLLPCIEKITMSLEDCAQVVLPVLQHCAEFELTAEANVALLSLLSSYGEMLPECVSMLFCYVEEYDNLEQNVRCALLTACSRQCDRPGMHSILQKLLRHIKQDDDPFLKGRAEFYSQALLNKCNKILVCPNPHRIALTVKPSLQFSDYPVSAAKPTPPPPPPPEPATDVPDTNKSAEVNDLLDISSASETTQKPNQNAPRLDDILGLGEPAKPVNPPTATIDNDLSAIFGGVTISPPKKPNSSEIDSVRNFLLTLSSAPIQAAVFEQHWGQNWKPEKLKVSLSETKISVSTDIQAVFSKNSISTMAITPPTVDPRQIFLYSNSAGMLILLKVILSFVGNSFEVEVRAANYMISQMMVKSVKHIIGVL